MYFLKLIYRFVEIWLGVSKVIVKGESSWLRVWRRRVLFHGASSREEQFVRSITSSFPFLPLSLDEMLLSSSLASSVLSPIIAGLILFHFSANADHKPTVYKSKNYKPFKVSIQKTKRQQAKNSAGKILVKRKAQPRPPSLPIQIFWEYGKVGFWLAHSS